MLQLITPPADVPSVCRCCGCTLEAIYQQGLLPHHRGLWLVTCPNEGGCVLAKQTLEASKYLTRDLSAYGFTEHLLDRQASTEPTI